MPDLNYKDIVLVPNQSVVESRSQCNTSVKLGYFDFNSPVVPANMKSILTPEICKIFDEAGWFYVFHRIDGVSEVKKFVVYANETFRVTSISVGVKPEWIQLVRELAFEGRAVHYFTVDVAHSHNDNVIPIVNEIKEKFPNSYVILGNGCTKSWVRWAKKTFIKGITQKVNALKIGIGVSRSCRTRQFTGFGSSTVSSLLECVGESASDFDIISDGGITIEGDTVCIGDVAKSLCLGASMVMSGALFSKCLDSPSMKTGYFGNASVAAKGTTHVEGTTVKVESTGLTIKETMSLIQESLQSSISYSGSLTIDGMRRNTDWREIHS